MKNRKIQSIAVSAIIAALYVVLTMLSNIFGLAYGPIQFRVSEMLTILPVFFPAAIPGLTIGCILSNITSTINPLDMVIGSFATLLAAVLTALFRKVTIKGYPLLSFLMPVLCNGFIVGAEILFLFSDTVSFSLFWVYFAEVAAGELAVVFILGSIFHKALYKVIPKNRMLKELSWKELRKNPSAEAEGTDIPTSVDI